MTQSFQYTRTRQPFEMVARLAQADAAQDGGADGELAADQMIERHAACDQVAASLHRQQRNLIFARHALERFALDERQLAVRRICARLEEMAIADQPATGDGIGTLDGDERLAFAFGHTDADQLTLEHDPSFPYPSPPAHCTGPCPCAKAAALFVSVAIECSQPATPQARRLACGLGLTPDP